MGTVKKIFLGKKDPDCVLLEKVFPIGNLVFSMPFGVEAGRHRRIVIEGAGHFLQSFDQHAGPLLERKPDAYGHWVAIAPYVLDSSMELIYEPRCSETLKTVMLLVLILRADLVEICNLRLSPISMVTGTKEHVTVFNKLVPLATAANGFVDIAPLIASPAQFPSIKLN